MNAERYVRIAKLLLAADKIIAVRAGYYSNAGLDMGQYDKDESVKVELEMDESGKITGKAEYHIIGGQHPGFGTKDDDSKVFGSISQSTPNALASAIDRWSNSWFESKGMERHVKRNWVRGGGRRVALKTILKDIRKTFDVAERKEPEGVPDSKTEAIVNIRERTREELKKGLAGWVKAYNEIGSYGNDSLKRSLKADIEKVIVEKDLDARMVWAA